jgi:hypothetical protein
MGHHQPRRRPLTPVSPCPGLASPLPKSVSRIRARRCTGLLFLQPSADPSLSAARTRRRTNMPHEHTKRSQTRAYTDGVNIMKLKSGGPGPYCHLSAQGASCRETLRAAGSDSSSEAEEATIFRTHALFCTDIGTFGMVHHHQQPISSASHDRWPLLPCPLAGRLPAPMASILTRCTVCERVSGDSNLNTN